MNEFSEEKFKMTNSAKDQMPRVAFSHLMDAAQIHVVDF